MQQNWRLSPWLWSDLEKARFREHNPSAQVTPIWIAPNGTIYAKAYGSTFIAANTEYFRPQSVHVTEFQG